MNRRSFITGIAASKAIATVIPLQEALARQTDPSPEVTLIELNSCWRSFNSRQHRNLARRCIKHGTLGVDGDGNPFYRWRRGGRYTSDGICLHWSVLRNEWMLEAGYDTALRRKLRAQMRYAVFSRSGTTMYGRWHLARIPGRDYEYNVTGRKHARLGKRLFNRIDTLLPA